MQRLPLGMAHGHHPAGHPCVHDHTVAVPATQAAHGHPPVRQVGLVGERRCEPVRRVGHGPRRHHRHGQHHRRGHSHHAGRPGGRVLVLADGRVRHRHEIRRRIAGREIPCPQADRQDGGRPHVRFGTWTAREVVGRALLHIHGLCLIWHRQPGAEQRHLHAMLRNLPNPTGIHRNGHRHLRGLGGHLRRERHRPRVHGLRPVHGRFLCPGMLLHPLRERGIRVGCPETHP